MLVHLDRVIPETEPLRPIPDPPIPIREVTRQIAFEPGGWTAERRQKVGQLFDGLAPEWATRPDLAQRKVPLEDAYQRGDVPRGGFCLELGSGTGATTAFLAGQHDLVVAADLSIEMLRQAEPAAAPRVQCDGSVLPFGTGSVAVAALVNMFLFPAEIDRVLAPDGVLVWVSTAGDRTPIYLSADDVVRALPGNWQGTHSEAGQGTWTVVRRT